MARFYNACQFSRLCSQHKSNTKSTQHNTNVQILQRLPVFALCVPNTKSTQPNKCPNATAPASFCALCSQRKSKTPQHKWPIQTQTQRTATQMAKFCIACQFLPFVFTKQIQHKPNIDAQVFYSARRSPSLESPTLRSNPPTPQAVGM